MKNIALNTIFALLPVLATLSQSCSRHQPESNPGQPAYSQEDIDFDSRLQKYPGMSFSSEMTGVYVDESSVTVCGNNREGKDVILVEIPPYRDLFKTPASEEGTTVKTGEFSITVDRYAAAGSQTYDRMLSKWVLMDSNGSTMLSPVSFARYPDRIPQKRDVPAVVLRNKKGMGGIINNSLQFSDLDDLDIGSATINLFVTAFTYTAEGAGRIPHEYGGKTYWFDEEYLRTNLDKPLREAARRKMSVAGILLVGLPSSCADPELSKIINHPDCSGGNLTYPDMTDPEGVNCFAAITDFLAERYTRPDRKYGRIAHWIVMNEIDAPTQWANIGPKPLYYNADYYMKLLRTVHAIVGQYDSNAEIFASFTHSWTLPAGDFPGKTTLEYISKVCTAEGDFRWALAWHSYPGDLLNPRSWACPMSTYSMDTQCITFGNLEVLDKWIRKPENMYMGVTKRSVWLSEAGINSRSYSDQDLAEQAAGYAYAWKKIEALDGIDAHQWHNWMDNPTEGVNLGLRKLQADPYNAGSKPVWYVFQAAGSDYEDTVFDNYLPVIGIEDWDIICDESQIR